ncbi:MAG: DUF6477 family protein [Roseinatronobacter sp.]
MHMKITAPDTQIRPRLLVVASRYGLDSYERARALPHLLQLPLGRALPARAEAIAQLAEMERALEAARLRHDASWSAAQHVAVMTALQFELLSDPAPLCL